MSDTIADVKIKDSEYTDLYASTNISVGTKLVIQNKKLSAVYIQILPSIPDPSSTDGYLLAPNQSCVVTGTISKVWAIGNSTISVQEYEE